jgi:transposase-like protein
MVYQSRWQLGEKVRIVMASLNTSVSVAELCRKHGGLPKTFYAWKLGLSGALLRNGTAGKELGFENERLKTLIGELTIPNGS